MSSGSERHHPGTGSAFTASSAVELSEPHLVSVEQYTHVTRQIEGLRIAGQVLDPQVSALLREDSEFVNSGLQLLPQMNIAIDLARFQDLKGLAGRLL